jgi:hypothetical protein
LVDGGLSETCRSTWRAARRASGDCGQHRHAAAGAKESPRLRRSDQLTRILTNTNVGQSLKARIRRRADHTRPGTVGTADFDRLPEAAVAGEKLHGLWCPAGRLQMDAESYAARRRREQRSPRAARSTSRRWRSKVSSGNPEAIAARCTRNPATLDAATADADMRHIYGNGDFAQAIS